MSYIEKNLVPGEKLLYQTRHHWIVLLGPMFFGLLLGAFGVWLLVNAMDAAPERGTVAARPAASATIPPNVWGILGAIFLLAAIVVASYGVMKRNATEMAVTNRRVFVKAGMASRRTFDLMLPKVESIGVEESFAGRMLGFGSVILHGTGGTPESFQKIDHPQEFRRHVQQQLSGG